MVQWMEQHNCAHHGKHWKGDIHRRYAQAKHNHVCGKGCDKRDPLAMLKKSKS